MIRKLLVLAWLLLPSLAWADYASVILADSPVHYYHMGEPSGTQTTDSGSSTLNGAYVGGFTLSQSGIIGYPTNNAVTFNGTTGYSELSTGAASCNPSTTNNVGWTVEVWANPSALATKVVVGVAGLSAGQQHAWFIATIAGGTFQANTYEDGSSCGGGNYANTGNVGGYTAGGGFHHLVLTTLGAGSGAFQHQRFYVDGTLLSNVTSFSGAFCSLAGSNYVAIGAAIQTNHTPEFFFGGTTDEVAFYGSELSQGQVTTHYNAGLGIAATGAGLPFSVKRDTLKPSRFGFTRPILNVSAPGFVVDRMNKGILRGLYEVTR